MKRIKKFNEDFQKYDKNPFVKNDDPVMNYEEQLKLNSLITKDLEGESINPYEKKFLMELKELIQNHKDLFVKDLSGIEPKDFRPFPKI